MVEDDDVAEDDGVVDDDDVAEDDGVVDDDDVAEDDGVVEGDFVVDDVTETNSQGPGQWSGRNGQCLS